MAVDSRGNVHSALLSSTSLVNKWVSKLNENELEQVTHDLHYNHIIKFNRVLRQLTVNN